MLPPRTLPLGTRLRPSPLTGRSIAHKTPSTLPPYMQPVWDRLQPAREADSSYAHVRPDHYRYLPPPIKKPAAIFLDQGVLPAASSPALVVRELRTLGLSRAHSIQSMKAYINVASEPETAAQRAGLTACGIEIRDFHNVVHGKTASPNLMIVTDMYGFVHDNYDGGTIIIFTNDPTYSIALNSLRNRGYNIVVLCSRHLFDDPLVAAGEHLDLDRFMDRTIPRRIDSEHTGGRHLSRHHPNSSPAVSTSITTSPTSPPESKIHPPSTSTTIPPEMRADVAHAFASARFASNAPRTSRSTDTSTDPSVISPPPQPDHIPSTEKSTPLRSVAKVPKAPKFSKASSVPASSTLPSIKLSQAAQSSPQKSTVSPKEIDEDPPKRAAKKALLFRSDALAAAKEAAARVASRLTELSAVQEKEKTAAKKDPEATGPSSPRVETFPVALSSEEPATTPFEPSSSSRLVDSAEDSSTPEPSKLLSSIGSIISNLGYTGAAPTSSPSIVFPSIKVEKKSSMEPSLIISHRTNLKPSASVPEQETTLDGPVAPVKSTTSEQQPERASDQATSSYTVGIMASTSIEPTKAGEQMQDVQMGSPTDGAALQDVCVSSLPPKEKFAEDEKEDLPAPIPKSAPFNAFEQDAVEGIEDASTAELTSTIPPRPEESPQRLSSP